MTISTAITNAMIQNKPDHFEPLETHWHFPCGMCVHQSDSMPAICKDCRFYIN